MPDESIRKTDRHLIGKLIYLSWKIERPSLSVQYLVVIQKSRSHIFLNEHFILRHKQRPMLNYIEFQLIKEDITRHSAGQRLSNLRPSQCLGDLVEISHTAGACERIV